MCEKIPEEYKHLLKDGINCITFEDDLSNFESKMRYYLNNEQERQKIVNNAINYFHNNWTWDHAAEELINLMREII